MATCEQGGTARNGAVIIPFPRPMAQPTSPPLASDQGEAEIVNLPLPATANPTERLQRALRMLMQAQEQQRIALQKWRGSISELSSSVKSLEGSLYTYQDKLGTLAGELPPPA